MSPNAGGGGELRGLSQRVQLYTGAHINFGDPTPYLTYGPSEAVETGFEHLRRFRHRKVVAISCFARKCRKFELLINNLRYRSTHLYCTSADFYS
jgi:hypothetical protein